jgi:membrane-bound lytic murein transglycosylase D
LFLIARRYGVSVEALVRANDLSPSAILRVGSRLVIPKEALGEESSQDQGSSLRKSLKKTVVRNLPKTRVHWVRRGENLQSIAARYNTSVRALIAKNSIQNPSKLLVGTKLLVPVETRQN